MKYYTVKKRFTSFPSPAGMSLTKLPLGRNNSVMTSLFPPRESLVVTSRLGTGNSRSFFYSVSSALENCSSGNGKAPCWCLNILYTGAFPFPELQFSRGELHFDQPLLQCRSRQIVPTIMHSRHNFDFIDFIGMFKDYAVVKTNLH